MVRHLSCILWPSFLAAGLAEALVFVLFDPADVLGGSVSLSRTAVYSGVFFALWALMTLSSGLTWVLQRSSEEVNRLPSQGSPPHQG